MKQPGKMIMILSHSIKRHLDNLHASDGLNSKQARLLRYIELSDHDVYQKEIEDEFGIRKSSVSSFLTILERNGLIERKSVESDARLKKIILTEKGLDLNQRTFHSLVEYEDELLSLFNTQEQDQLIEYLERISDYMNQIEKGE